MRLLTKVVAVLASIGAGGWPIGSAAQSAADAALERRVDAYLQPLLATHNFSGVILVTRGEQVLLEKGYGFASIEHQVTNSPATVFQVASVSKPFTSAAIMLLREEGKLDIGAPLTAVLPGYPNGGKLTIRHLLTHTSGIPNINDFEEYESVQHRHHDTAQLVAHFRDKPLEFEPGAKYSYSNSNYNLLAHIIETVSGRPYGEFLEQRVFAPLGLKSIGHRGSATKIVRNLATGYAPSGAIGLERAPYLDWTVKTGNGSLYSNARDVARFIRAVHSGDLLTKASVSATFERHTPNAGMGWFLTQANGREVHHVNGRSPGYAAQADYYVADDVAVVVLANTYISVTTDVARAVGAHLFRRPVEPLPAIKADALPARMAAALTGQYQFGPDYYVPNALITVAERGGYLEAMVGEYGPYPFVQISPTRFLIRSFWVPAEFTLGRDGRAVELSIDGRKGVRK